MAWVPLLLVVLAHSSGSLVQAALSQPSSMSANVGETIKITCSDGNANKYFGWYQQKVPGTAPVTVIYKDTNRPSDIPSRFSGSASGSTATLTITGVQAEDEAVYYCDNNATLTQSNGEVRQELSTMAGASQPVVAPTVHLFPPSLEEVSKNGKATLVCLMENFYPSPVKVEWSSNGSPITANVVTSQSQRQSNNQYMASSYLSLEASQWNNYGSVSCKVTHETGSVEKTVNRSEC
ncbi:IGL1 protein, partial [Furnarius figulus]|nr:IGL1 protein [Furnarius figulus]